MISPSPSAEVGLINSRVIPAGNTDNFSRNTTSVYMPTMINVDVRAARKMAIANSLGDYDKRKLG